MNTQWIWLNSACVGPHSNEDGQLSTSDAALVLTEAYADCAKWVAEWCGVDQDQVLLTAGATDACDIALTTGIGTPALLMHSDLAHECTIRSVECAADFVGALTRRTIKVRKLRISDLFDLGPEAFAKELVGRISSVCDGRGTVVLVLEHVTSLDGWLLPAAEIARRIHRITPHVELILDGAQAVGLWQPPKGLNYAYVGCFHKYVDGPVGTGFCVLPPGRADVALHRIRATQSWRFTGTGEHLPTTDVAKWKRCADALLSLSARGSARAREARIRKLRQELINQLPSEITSQVPSHQAVYRSHIFSLAFPSVDEAVRIHDRLQASAFGTKRLENLIRVTLHDTNDSSSLSSFAAFVSDAMKNEQFRHDRSTSVGDGRGF